MLTKLVPLLLLAGSAAQTHAHRDHGADAYTTGEFDDYEEGVTRVKLHAPPESFLDLLGYLAPVLKYYVVLMGLFVAARYFNRMLEAEDSLKEKEMQKRPTLSRDLMRDSDEEEEDDDEESEGEAEVASALKKKQQELAAKKAKKAAAAVQDDDDEVHEELFTDGSKLVAMSESELKARQKKKSHPLFEGLQKIEEELKQKKLAEEEEKVSWNDLHHSMLKRYQQKYPEHGLRMQKDDDYDDEFKELLKKHNIDPEEIRRDLKKDA